MNKDSFVLPETESDSYFLSDPIFGNESNYLSLLIGILLRQLLPLKICESAFSLVGGLLSLCVQLVLNHLRTATSVIICCLQRVEGIQFLSCLCVPRLGFPMIVKRNGFIEISTKELKGHKEEVPKVSDNVEGRDPKKAIGRIYFDLLGLVEICHGNVTVKTE